MPMRIDAKAKECCVRQVLEQLAEYPSATSAAEAALQDDQLGWRVR